MFEKFPKEYSQSKIQKIIERIMGEGKSGDKALTDLSEELKSEIANVEKKLSKKIAQKGQGAPSIPHFLPPPKDLNVLGIATFGIASCMPYFKWKYKLKIRGYEFYGSHNTGFSPQTEPYTQTGTHYTPTAWTLLHKDEPCTYLNTKDATDSSNTFYLEGVLNGLTLENVDEGTSGEISGFSRNLPLTRNAPFRLTVDGVTWNDGDTWRIKKYPSNKLFNMGPLAVFPKYPLKTFYVRARTEGAGHSYSSFTDEVDSTYRGEVDDVTGLTVVKDGDVYTSLGHCYQDALVTWDDAEDEEEIGFYDIRHWKEGKHPPII